MYIVLTTDEFTHSEVFFVDADKFDKKAVEDMIKQKYAARYLIKPADVEVHWLVEPPKLERR